MYYYDIFGNPWEERKALRCPFVLKIISINFCEIKYIKQFLVSVSAIQMCVCVCVCGGGGDIVCNDLFGVYYLMILCCLYQKE